MIENIHRKRFFWPELDVLRGIAVVMMLTNHAAVNWLGPLDNINGISGILSFIGSFAPVMFFFITGCGYGISHNPGSSIINGHVFYKALILVLMDGIMRQHFPLFTGWDFLAFIGLSMLVLQVLKGRRNAILIAASVIVFFVLLRFLGAHIYKRIVLDETQKTWLSIIIGVNAAPGISYWFAPWSVYPLFGFIAGMIVKEFNGYIQRFRFPVILVLIILGSVVGVVSEYLYKRGAIYFRWGTMSINFFIISFSVIAFSLSLSIIVCSFKRADKMRQAVSMRGISSLAVVPLHYFLISLIELKIPGVIKPWLFYCILPFWLSIAIMLSKLLNGYMKKISIQLSPPNGWWFIPVLIICTILLLLQMNIVVMEIIKLFMQLVLCFLLSCSIAVFEINKKNRIEKV